jgi:RHS repeat-associated protein
MCRSSSGDNYLYDGANIVEERDPAGIALTTYTQGAGVDQPLAMRRAASTSYYEQDGLGSVTSLTDGNGSIAATYVYDGYGQVVGSTGSLINPFRFTGREWDSETEHYYYRARYYNPEVGEFISEDPIRFSGGGNFYQYASNDPSNNSDPSGLLPFANKLSECVKKLLQPYFPTIDLNEIRLNKQLGLQLLTDAITDGNDIYYDPMNSPFNTMPSGFGEIAHEIEHSAQYAELGKPKFQFKYLKEYFSNRIKGMSDYDAYQAVSIEGAARRKAATVTSDLASKYGLFSNISESYCQ